MNIRLQDGVYDAHLEQCAVKQGSGGRPVLCFQWRLDRSGVLIRSFVGLSMKDGSPNQKGIDLVRKWATGWDGDPYWFGEHPDEARTYAVRLTIKNEPAWNDPSRIVPVVKWVNPTKPTEPAEPSEPIAPAEHPALPPDVELEPTMQDTWRLWCLMTSRCSATFRDKTWLWYAHETAPEKDQVDFTADDWSRMQQHIRLTNR